MTTDFATVEDMLEVLDANPSLLESLRVRILTRELLELPQVVADLSQTVAELSQTVAELSSSHLRLENTLRQFMESTDARFNELNRDLSVIKGRHVETDLQGKIHGILGTQRLMRAQVVRAGYPAVALPAFCDKMYKALENGIITDEQYRRVMDTDLIARARRRGFDERVYVAVEAAYQLDKDDVDRVERTAQTLAAVFPKAEIRAMVYGLETSGDVMFHAESKGVEALLGRS